MQLVVSDLAVPGMLAWALHCCHVSCAGAAAHCWGEAAGALTTASQQISGAEQHMSKGALMCAATCRINGRQPLQWPDWWHHVLHSGQSSDSYLEIPVQASQAAQCPSSLPEARHAAFWALVRAQDAAASKVARLNHNTAVSPPSDDPIRAAIAASQTLHSRPHT